MLHDVKREVRRMEQVQTTIRLPAELKKKLEQEADRRGYTLKDLILFILWDFVGLPSFQE